MDAIHFIIAPFFTLFISILNVIDGRAAAIRQKRLPSNRHGKKRRFHRIVFISDTFLEIEQKQKNIMLKHIIHSFFWDGGGGDANKNKKCENKTVAEK